MLTTEQKQLKSILDKLLVLGMSTLSTNEQILEALQKCNSCKLSHVEKLTKKERYKAIDEIDNLIIKIFALYSPEASDLRELVAFLKITNEFDRIANNCHSFIRDFPNAIDSDVDKELILEYAIPLQKTSVNALSNALGILQTDDKQLVEERYKAVVVEESKNDDLYKIIEKSLLKKIDKNMSLSLDYQNVMAALRRLEKVADRALSIAGLLHYAKIGGELGHMGQYS